MRVLLLSEPGSPHTIKWARSLSENGIEICIFGLSALSAQTAAAYSNYRNIRIYYGGVESDVIKKGEGNISKLSYLKMLPRLKEVIGKFNPDIVHAHYATSYGLLGALSGFHPFILSVWGTDVFDFPRKSLFHRGLLKYSLWKADKILSTSYVMAQETNNYTSKQVEVLPFGIDLNIFKPMNGESVFCKNDTVIGTVKNLEEKYGIQHLITAFRIVKENHPKWPLKLLIVGGGSQEGALKRLVADMRIEHDTIFTGQVKYDEVPKYQNMLSISVTVSNSESFGVAVIEASACEKPVVVSDVGGLPEVVEDGKTGFIVPPGKPQKIAAAIEKLMSDRELMGKMGKAGRHRVQSLYDWNCNVNRMCEIYVQLQKSGAPEAVSS